MFKSVFKGVCLHESLPIENPNPKLGTTRWPTLVANGICKVINITIWVTKWHVKVCNIIFSLLTLLNCFTGWVTFGGLQLD